jgi:hypothetical protein
MRALLWLPFFALCANADVTIEFARHIEPLLRARCQGCHGAALQSSGLRLDNPRDALAGGYSGAVILPGKSAESRLIRLVSGADPKIVMPPVGKRLTPAEVGLLRAWIDQGAKWPAAGTREAPVREEKPVHWAARPLARVEPPATRNRTWARNPIDRFILARLEDRGIEPSPEADRHTLVRRLFLDLTGLPPSPEQVLTFVKDNRAGAWELLCDSLLEAATKAGAAIAPREARIAANEIWKTMFGRGLAGPFDLDEPGPPPSHPELLEWVAVRLQAEGVNAVRRLIATSAAYRQASRPRPDLARLDPENALVARQARLELPAGVVRDAVLAVSELLDPRPGPPLPASRERYLRSQHRKDGPEPAAIREEASRALAARLSRETGGASLRERIWRLYLICCSREPHPAEEERVEQDFRRHASEFERDPAATASTFPVDLEGAARSDAAAWTRIAAVLLGSEEFRSRE